MHPVEVDPGMSCGRMVRTGTSWSRMPALVIALLSCVLHLGCRAVETIWSAQAVSPDGYWLATAKTELHGGFGTAGVVTSVYLKRTNGSSPAVEILGFFHDAR